MRVVVGLFALGLLSSAAAVAAADSEADRVHAACDALPAIGTIDSGPTTVVLRASVSDARATELMKVARAVYADVNARFVASRDDAVPVVTLCLASTEDEYATLGAAFADVPSPLGFYRPDLRVSAINLARGIGNLRHELVHPLIGDDFPGIPSWLNEGMGSLYGTAKPSKAGMQFLVNYRLKDLQRALKDGTLPTLSELVGSTHADVHGDRAMTFYALGRYLMLYLDRHGTLDATYAALRAAAGDTDAQLAALTSSIDEDAFRAWARKLRWHR